MSIHVTSFNSMSYYVNVRLTSNMHKEQRSQFYILDIHVSTVERPLPMFSFKPHKANKIYIFSISFMVVQVLYKTVIRIEDPEPYPQPNGGQNLGALGVLPLSYRNIPKTNG